MLFLGKPISAGKFMIRFPNCKINIGLYITNKRADGYHDLETVFYPVQLCDALEIVPAEETKLYLSGKAVAGNEQDNLVWKAYTMLQQQFPDKVKPVAIYLHKAIPMGAGLGGGSADGAFMLQLVNDFFELELDKKQLAERALQLGSDCPFFIENKPVFAKGRGEEMMRVPLNLSNYSIQLVCPDIHISTKEAFALITPKPSTMNLQKLHELPVVAWNEYVYNAFELPVCKKYPVIKEIIDQLYVQGAIYAAMSGSGSAVYGIFAKGRKAVITSEIQFEDHYIE